MGSGKFGFMAYSCYLSFLLDCYQPIRAPVSVTTNHVCSVFWSTDPMCCIIYTEMYVWTGEVMEQCQTLTQDCVVAISKMEFVKMVPVYLSEMNRRLTYFHHQKRGLFHLTCRCFSGHIPALTAYGLLLQMSSCSMVCLYVCLLVTESLTKIAKTAEPIKLLLIES